MVAFDQSGNVKGIASSNGDSPVMAVSDGGFISYKGITYDAKLNITGQLPNFPTLTESWTGDEYKSETSGVSQISRSGAYPASTFAAIVYGNNSFTGTAFKQAWGYPLVKCSEGDSGSEECKANGWSNSTGGPRDWIWNAKVELAKRLADGRMNMLIPRVFSNEITYKAFLTYLAKGAQFYDGTRSTATLDDALCPGERGKEISRIFKVDNIRSDGTHICNTAALTCSGYKPMLRVFWDPRAISFANNGKQDLNIATVFHEALHGFTAYSDEQLQSYLGCTSQDDTRNISYYLKQFVLEKAPTGAPPICTYVENHSIPNSPSCAW